MKLPTHLHTAVMLMVEISSPSLWRGVRWPGWVELNWFMTTLFVGLLWDIYIMNVRWGWFKFICWYLFLHWSSVLCSIRPFLKAAIWQCSILLRIEEQTATFLMHLCDTLTTWGRVLLEKLILLLLVKKFPAFYGTRRCTTEFTRGRHLPLSWARSVQSMPPYPTSLRSILIFSSMPGYSMCSLSLPKPYMHLSSHKCVLHAPPLSFFSIGFDMIHRQRVCCMLTL